MKWVFALVLGLEGAAGILVVGRGDDVDLPLVGFAWSSRLWRVQLGDLEAAADGVEGGRFFARTVATGALSSYDPCATSDLRPARDLSIMRLLDVQLVGQSLLLLPRRTLVCRRHQFARARGLREDRQSLVVLVADLAASVVRADVLDVYNIGIVGVAEIAEADEGAIEANLRLVACLLKLGRRARNRLRLIGWLMLLGQQRVIILFPILVSRPVDHLLRYLLVSFISLPPLRATINIPTANDHRVEVRAALVIEVILLIHLLRALLDVYIRIGARLNECPGNRLTWLLTFLRQPFCGDLFILIIIALQECQIQVERLRLLGRPLQGAVEECQIGFADTEELRRHLLLRCMK